MSPVPLSSSILVEELLQGDPFGTAQADKKALYSAGLSELTRHHREHCPRYRRILHLLGYDGPNQMPVEEVPFIPVRLFKEYKLSSVPDGEIVRTMSSSGTTGQAVSKIYLDQATAANQTKVLVRIMTSVLGGKRLPFLVVDSPEVLKDRSLFSARGAGILGFSMLGYDLSYALDRDYRIDLPRLDSFLEKHGEERILIFGFTFVVWEHLIEPLRRSGRKLNLNGILLHGGGWKKLATRAVDPFTFRAVAQEVLGVSTVANYYGMIEQTGSIFIECEQGVLHASAFSDVIVRDPKDFAPLPMGDSGLLQLVSLLPGSYPGHSILSEDTGRILGVDDCACGRKGTYFEVHGRIKNAEVRGCSDTHASPE